MGTVELASMPAEMRQTFQAFEDIVNGQTFSVLDMIEDRIKSLALKVAFGEGPAIPVENVQVFPSAGTVSFELASQPVNRPTQP